MADDGGGWIQKEKFTDSLKATHDNTYKANDEVPNVFVHADMDTVEFDHTANIEELIKGTVDAHFGTTCSTRITAYTSSSDPGLIAALKKPRINFRPFLKRKMSCKTCKEAREARGGRGGRGAGGRVVGQNNKPELLELEMLLSICLEAVDLTTKSDVPRQGAIWIISNDHFFKDELFENLDSRELEVYWSIPDYMIPIPMYQVQKVPATPMEALKSPLMGIFEKRRASKFFSFVQEYDEKDPKTHNGMDLTKVTTKELIAKFGLDDNTIDFIGHAVALHTNDQHLHQPAFDAVMRMKLYAESLARFQGTSPYIYPLYGLGELPQAFARLSAVYGGTYMLNKPECKVEFDEEGKVTGVTSEGEIAKCKKVVCDPSYLPNKVRKIGRVARAIAIMSHPIPNTNDSHSVQVIIPQKQLARKSDMYVFCCSYSHNVALKGKFIAFVSTDAETDNPQTELKPGTDLLGPVDEIFFDMYDRYEPVNEPALDNCFISTCYDATTHFETTVADVLNMYTLITGKQLDLSVDLSAASAAEE